MIKCITKLQYSIQIKLQYFVLFKQNDTATAWTDVIPRSPLAGFRPLVCIFWLANQDSRQRLRQPITFECFGTRFNSSLALPESAAGQTKQPRVNKLQDLNLNPLTENVR